MERELFLPIKEYFETFGYVCDGEVKDIDLYMEKDGYSVAVELKINLDFKSVLQAASRQKIVDTVFIGIFRPKDMNSSSFKDKLYLLKRLGIGLIVVSKRTKMVEIVNEPVVSELSKYQLCNKNGRDAVASEFQKRKIKSNVGGVSRTKLITSYRESALLVLKTLATMGGQGKGSDVKAACGVSNATAIMRDNFYGWFEKVSTGIYKIRPEGYEAMKEFEDVILKLNGDIK